MNIVVAILALLSAVCIVLLSSVVPKKPPFSFFELERRHKQDLSSEPLEYSRAHLFAELRVFQRLLMGVLLVILSVCFTLWVGALLAVVLAFVVLLLHGIISRVPLVHSFAQGMYDAHEAQIIAFTKKHQKKLRWIRSPRPKRVSERLYSKAELEHLINTSHGLLTDQQKQTLKHSLDFYERTVGDCMTKVSAVHTVKKTEMLGPLLLDELHKAGHSHFPVIKNDINSVVGVLQLNTILKVDTTRKHTATAESAMDKKVYYLHQQQPLTAALNSFITNHHQLAVVINSQEETVGILTLQDVTRALVGWAMDTQNDNSDDRRAVASYDQ